MAEHTSLQVLLDEPLVMPRLASSPAPAPRAPKAGQPIVDEAGNRFTQDYEDRVHALP